MAASSSRAEHGEIRALRPAHGELHHAWRPSAIDRETRRIRPAVAHHAEHAGDQRAELRLQRLVLEKQADNAAHRRSLRMTGDDSRSLVGGQAQGVNGREYNFL